MEKEILKVLNENKHYVIGWTEGFTEDDFEDLAQKLDALFALRSVVKPLKENCRDFGVWLKENNIEKAPDGQYFWNNRLLTERSVIQKYREANHQL